MRILCFINYLPNNPVRNPPTDPILAPVEAFFLALSFLYSSPLLEKE
jgi:hypothetical protein